VFLLPGFTVWLLYCQFNQWLGIFNVKCQSACCHLVQNLLSFSLLSKNIRLRYTTLYFACCFVWVWNVVTHIEGGTLTEGGCEQRDEVTGGWRKLQNEELNDLYSPPNIACMIKWRKMRWAMHAAGMGWGKRCIMGVW